MFERVVFARHVAAADVLHSRCYDSTIKQSYSAAVVLFDTTPFCSRASHARLLLGNLGARATSDSLHSKMIGSLSVTIRRSNCYSALMMTAVHVMQVEPSLHTGVASCACQLHDKLVFLESSLDNSLLVHVTDRQVSLNQNMHPGRSVIAACSVHLLWLGSFHTKLPLQSSPLCHHSQNRTHLRFGMLISNPEPVCADKHCVQFAHCDVQLHQHIQTVLCLGADIEEEEQAWS